MEHFVFVITQAKCLLYQETVNSLTASDLLQGNLRTCHHLLMYSDGVRVPCNRMH